MADGGGGDPGVRIRFFQPDLCVVGTNIDVVPLVGHGAVWTVSGIPMPDLGALDFLPTIAVPWWAPVQRALLGVEVGSPSLAVM
jgi:hypothetical protein